MADRTSGQQAPSGRRSLRLPGDRATQVIAAVLLGALGVMLVGWLMAPERQDDMWVNLVSRSAQLIALALAGGVVGAVIHDRDAAREAVERRDAYLRGFLDEVEAAFAQTKTSRRMLRALGFDGRRDVPLSVEGVRGFREQMALLNDAELQFESLARKAATLNRPFGSAAMDVTARLSDIHRYLNGVLREWEAGPDVVIAEGSTAATLAWPRLIGFLGYDDDAEGSFRRGVADAILAIELQVGAISTAALPEHPS